MRVTFVRAQLFHSGLTILSDWYVTDPASTKPANYKDGTLKALRLSPRICVAYAGRIDICLQAIKTAEARFAANLFQDGLDTLAAATLNEVCEFVVGTTDPPGLFELKQGESRSCAAAWIGDHRAFESCQRQASIVRESQTDDRAVLHQAFREVIESGLIEGVGVTTVAVIAGSSGFEYAPSMTAVVGFSPQPIPPDTWRTVTWGQAHDGGFAESVMGAARHAAVGVYFPYGGFGVLSAPLDLKETVVVDGRDQDEFVRKVQAAFGIVLEPGIEMR